MTRVYFSSPPSAFPSRWTQGHSRTHSRVSSHGDSVHPALLLPTQCLPGHKRRWGRTCPTATSRGNTLPTSFLALFLPPFQPTTEAKYLKIYTQSVFELQSQALASLRSPWTAGWTHSPMDSLGRGILLPTSMYCRSDPNLISIMASLMADVCPNNVAPPKEKRGMA